MKLLYTILGTYNSGGMERVLANKVSYLAKSGYDITIVTTDQKNRDSYYDFDKSITFIDLNINYTDSLNKSIITRGKEYFIKRSKHRKKLENLLFELKPDIVVSMFDNDAAFVADIKDGSKKVLEIHFSRFKRLQYKRAGIWKIIDYIRSYIDLKTAKKFDKFVVLTQEDKEYWGDMNNICIIPNSNSFESNTKAILEQKQVLAIGRFDYQKGFDDLIKVWSLVANNFPEWKLNIYGDGPLRSQFNNLILSLNLSGSINLCNPTPEIKDVYNNHSIFALSSRYEGLPMVLLEAQVFGLPLVSFACKCGPRDIIRDGVNGFLIQEGNIEMFANKLIYLIENEFERKKMGENSFLNSRYYNENLIMRQWISLFEELRKL